MAYLAFLKNFYEVVELLFKCINFFIKIKNIEINCFFEEVLKYSDEKTN